MVGKMVFGERILEAQKGENSRVIMMVGRHPVRFLCDWTRDGLERMAIFLASRGQTIIHPRACQVLRGAGSSAAA